LEGYTLTYVDVMQYEVSMDAYNRLSNTTDARGRKLEIFKLPRPPPMFRTFKEASGFKVEIQTLNSARLPFRPSKIASGFKVDLESHARQLRNCVDEILNDHDFMVFSAAGADS